MMKKFKWTDALACEFARVSSGGSYGPYQGCITVESKLKQFKKIKMNHHKTVEVTMGDDEFRVFEIENLETNSCHGEWLEIEHLRSATLSNIIDYCKGTGYSNFTLYDNTTPQKNPTSSARIGIKIKT